MTSGPAPLGAAAAGADGRPGRPTSVTVAAALVLVEAAALAVYAVVFVVRVFPLGEDAAVRLLMAVGVAVFLLLAAGALAAAARALAQLRHWPRALLVAVQLITLATALPLALDGMLVSWLIAAVAAIVGLLVLAPATTRAVER